VRQTPRLLAAAGSIVACLSLSTAASAAGATTARASHHKHHTATAPSRPASHRAGRRAGSLQRQRTKAPRIAGPRVGAPTVASAVARAQSRAASIASALEAPCGNGELTPEAGNLPLVRAAVMCLINRVRAQHGEAPLAANARLEQAAEEHDQEMIAADYFAHIAPDGKTPVDRIRATGYIPSPGAGYVIGENLAWGTLSLSTPQAIVAAWIASPGHLANILEAQYQDTGIAITPTVPSSLSGGQQGATYAQEFGVIQP
jgi:uncharacterized protein YkwD